MIPFRQFRHIAARRRLLKEALRGRDGAALAESCLPSYCHPNVAAAYAAWWRLFAAAGLWRRFAAAGPALDFGASAGELAPLLGPSVPYDFVEADDGLAALARHAIPAARRMALGGLPAGRYAAVFALDSLEHNDGPVREAIYGQFAAALKPGGVLIVSGPTENLLYRLGRWISGFSGDYHHTDVHDIHRELAPRFDCAARLTGPWRIPLFVVSVWRPRPASPTRE